MQDTIIIRPRLHGRFADDNLFEESLEYFKESGFDVIYKTYDLHNSEYDKDNIRTEHENMFTEKGIKIKFLIAKRK